MDFSALTEYLEQLKDQGVPGCDLCIWQAHRPIYRHFCGEASTGRETYWLYSATKVLTMTVLLRLRELGLLQLGDPVASYIPAFADVQVLENGRLRPPQTVMTLEHLMAMQGGLDYDLDAAPVQATMKAHNGDLTTLEMAAVYAQKPLHFDPGLGFRYSLCHDVAGAVAEAAAGKALGQLAHELVLDPLEIKGLTFHPDADQLHRLAPLYEADENSRISPAKRALDPVTAMPRYESGGGGLLGDVDSYILLADALANGGIGVNGRQILSRESIDDMRRDRQHGPAKAYFAKVLHKKGYGYGLGVRTLIDPAASRSPLGEFGWDGAAGAWVMMDPDHRIAAFYAQHVLNYRRVYYEFHPRIRDLIYEGLEL